MTSYRIDFSCRYYLTSSRGFVKPFYQIMAYTLLVGPVLVADVPGNSKIISVVSHSHMQRKCGLSTDDVIMIILSRKAC